MKTTIAAILLNLPQVCPLLLLYLLSAIYTFFLLSGYSYVSLNSVAILTVKILIMNFVALVIFWAGEIMLISDGNKSKY